MTNKSHSCADGVCENYIKPERMKTKIHFFLSIFWLSPSPRLVRYRHRLARHSPRVCVSVLVKECVKTLGSFGVCVRAKHKEGKLCARENLKG